jgi:hypothetical protein
MQQASIDKNFKRFIASILENKQDLSLSRANKAKIREIPQIRDLSTVLKR